MSHSLNSLAGHWQMHRPALESFIARINSTKLADIPRGEARPGDKPYSVENGVAEIEIVGVITDYPTDDWLDDFFGLCPAKSIIEKLEKAEADPAVTSICLYVDSPGGLATAGGMLAQAVAGCSKDIEARCGGLVASAAYRAVSQADAIVANRDSQIGAIGTYTVLADTSKMQDDIGYQLILVSSGGLKGAGADGRITAELKADVQREIAELNDLFVADVAKGRGLKQTRARELADGRVHIASSAKSLGLVDTIESVIKENKNMNPNQFAAFAAENPEDQTVKNLIAQGHKAGKADGATEGANQERQRVLALFSAFPGRADFIKSQIEKGADAQAAKADYADVLIEENKALSAKLAEKPAAPATPALPTAPHASAGHSGAIPLAPATVTAEQTAKPDGTDPKALAAWEWDNNAEACQSKFSSRDRYVSVRNAELTGRLRTK